MPSRLLLFALHTILALTPSQLILAQSVPQAEDPIQKQFAARVQSLEFSAGNDRERSFELKKQPVLNWSNPERSTPNGAMFAWTLDGVPQVAACVFEREG